MEQLHMSDAFRPMDASRLSHLEKNQSLEYLTFLKANMNGIIKGGACTDNAKPRDDFRVIKYLKAKYANDGVGLIKVECKYLQAKYRST